MMTETHHITDKNIGVGDGRNGSAAGHYQYVPWLLRVVLVSFDALAFVAAATLGSILLPYFQDAAALQAPLLGFPTAYMAYRKLHIATAAVVMVLMVYRGLYNKRMPWWSQVNLIMRITSFGLMAELVLGYILHTGYSLSAMALTWGVGFLFILLLRIMAFRMAPHITNWTIPTVIIGDSQTAEDIVYALSSDYSTGYKIEAIFIANSGDDADFDIGNLPKDQQNIKICFGQENHDEFIRDNPHHFYVLALDSFDKTVRETLLQTLNDNKQPYAIVPSISGTSLYQMDPKYFFGNDVLLIATRRSGLDDGMSAGRAAKRALDVVVAGASLLVLSPFFLLIMAMLKIEGQGGSPLYGGERIGQGGKLFRCWKFRSMEPNSDYLLTAYLDANPSAKADWEKYRKLPNDPRVTTRTARFIRKASIDELPQLWNVVVGDMSLVGPRPILENEVHYFDETMMKEYLSVKPGITGLWQVSGRNNTSFKRRVAWDSWYVRNWSMWGDIVILIKTPIVMLSRKGAS